MTRQFVADLRSKQQELLRKAIKKENIKLLLLGSGESGKSTIVKQMKIIHCNGFSEDDRLKYRAIVYSNTVISMAAILKAMKTLEIALEDPGLITTMNEFLHIVENEWEDGCADDDLFAKIHLLWKDAGVQQCFHRANEYQLNDSAGYFLNAIGRISSTDFVPTTDDILRTRAKTTGIAEIHFRLKETNFCLYDVGGQRSERKKWIYCFDNVQAVIFVTAMSDYDLKLGEDENMNKLHESLHLFSSVCVNRWFVTVTMIIFFNKTDIFRQKISSPGGTPLSSCFPNYHGDRYDFADNSNFIKEQFEAQHAVADKDVYSHFTCATDTSNLKIVFSVVTDGILKETLARCGLY